MTCTTTDTVTAVPDAAFSIRPERASDVAAREALLDVSFGPGRSERTCQRLRDGRLPADGLSFVAVRHGRLVGTVRLWHVNAGDRAVLVLGPLAVDPAERALGIGAALMRHALAGAQARGHAAVILLGDAPYYARFGFAPAPAGLSLPGPFERERLLGLEFSAGALTGASGMILPTGRRASRGDRLRRRSLRKAAA